MLAVRARAVLHGRLAPSVDDVLALAPPVLRHRMALGFAARAEGGDIDAVIDALLAAAKTQDEAKIQVAYDAVHASCQDCHKPFKTR